MECGAHDWGEAAMSWAISVGLIEGDGKSYNASGTATRAEVAAIVMRYINLF